jgi:hypothetical protein
MHIYIFNKKHTYIPNLFIYDLRKDINSLNEEVIRVIRSEELSKKLSKHIPY